jgi:hypothetical protein
MGNIIDFGRILQEPREALIKSRKSACLEKLPSEVGIYKGACPLVQ